MTWEGFAGRYGTMASDHGGTVAIGAGVRIRSRELADSELDAELIYDQLVSHVGECRICWPWRNQLWAVHRLCPRGAELADRYAVALGSKGEGQ
jgi:hypothetical protein